MDWVWTLAGAICGWLLRGLWLTLPELAARMHARAFRAYWRWRSRRPPGRTRIDPALIALIRRMARENPLWGAPRIHGELLRLGFTLAQSTVSKYMPKRRGGPSQDWATFLRNHDSAIAAVDMFTTPTLLFGRLYAFVVLLHHRRRILHVEVTDHPNALWLAQEIAAAFEHEPAPGFLVRDNDGAFGMTFRKRLRAMGIRDHPTSPHSPWQNGHAERLIGSIRRECLDHVIVVNAAHLRRLLQEYAEYYNNDRTHLALDKDAPNPRPIEREGAIRSRPVLGGLHRRYARSRRK